MKKTITEVLGIEKPIIQGPMNWLTNGTLVGEVSKTGALGVFGFNAGQSVVASSITETIENMRREILIAKNITKKPMGMNVSPASEGFDLFTQPLLDLMVEQNISIAVMVGDFSEKWTKKFHEKGIKVIYRALTPTIENTEEAIQGGADVIVATGFDEGGTVPENIIGTFSIVPMIVDAAKERVPVLAAGGISDSGTAKAALALGADGIFVGTAFMMAQESILAKNIKEKALSLKATDLLLYRTTPAFYRSLPGNLPQKLKDMSDAGVSEEEIGIASNQSQGMRDGMLFGDLDKGYASFGLGISLINKNESIETIVNNLMAGIFEY